MATGIILIIFLGFVIYCLTRIEGALNTVSNGLGNLYSQLDDTNLCLASVSKNTETFMSKLSDTTKLKLEEFASRDYLNSNDEAEQAYKNGLQDGVTMASQFVLGELEDE